MTEYLDLTDYLLIAQAVTGIDAVVLAKAARLELAESAQAAPQASFGEVEFYPEFVTKAAVPCARLAWNHPLPDGNKRAAWVALREFCARNGYRLKPNSVDDAVSAMEASPEPDPPPWLVIRGREGVPLQSGWDSVKSLRPLISVLFEPVQNVASAGLSRSDSSRSGSDVRELLCTGLGTVAALGHET